MMSAWNRPGDLEVVLGQLVNLLRDGVQVRMSKGTGEMVTFNELIDEVGTDATKYLMLSRSSGQAIDFDIEVAKRQDDTNPVYYVQYAHARICSILRKAAGIESNDADMDALAETFYVSKYHMMRQFRQETGLTVYEYLTQRRLLHARDLMEKGIRATEACYRSGFRSYSSFTRSYARIFGTTPTGRMDTAREREESYE
jgi:AraC-like DNA-binding protein